MKSKIRKLTVLLLVLALSLCALAPMALAVDEEPEIPAEEPTQADYSCTVTIPGRVEITGEKMPETSYTVTIEPVTEEAPMPEVTEFTTTETSEFSFGGIFYDVPDDYEYVIYQSDMPTDKHFTSDVRVYGLTVRVLNGEDGGLYAIYWLTVDNMDSKPDELVFTNTYFMPEPHIAVTKTATSKPTNGSFYVEGETITWKLTVANDGNVDLPDVAVVDSLTGDKWSIKTLAVGETKEFSASHKVTAAEAKAGKVANTVTAESTYKDPNANTPKEADMPVRGEATDTQKTGVPAVSPKTGDSANMALYIAVLAAAVTAVAIVVITRRKDERR